jgi:hypothetical protein
MWKSDTPSVSRFSLGAHASCTVFPSCYGCGTRFLFLGLTPDLGPGLISVAPPGLVGHALCGGNGSGKPKPRGSLGALRYKTTFAKHL